MYASNAPEGIQIFTIFQKMQSTLGPMQEKVTNSRTLQHLDTLIASKQCSAYFMIYFCCFIQGLYPFSETNFQDFFRTHNFFSQDSKNSYQLTLSLPRSCYLPYISYFSLKFNKLPELSRTSSLFQVLSSLKKSHNKNPGLSRFTSIREP